jgi:hypothetical protein
MDSAPANELLILGLRGNENTCSGSMKHPMRAYLTNILAHTMFDLEINAEEAKRTGKPFSDLHPLA